MKAVIVDDEQPAVDKLARLLEESGMAEVTGCFTEPLAALAFLEAEPADAVFLDIEMPGLDGLELASRTLDLSPGTAIVFVTAYNQYAVEAFRLNALDYLMKPVTAQRLRQTLLRLSKKTPPPPPPPARVQIHCFGRFRVCAGDVEIRFRTEKAEELLAYLVGCGGAFVSRSKIIDDLWEDFEGDRAVTHFNTTLHYVKKALLEQGVHINVRYDRGAYRLDTAGLDCDYLRFCGAVGTLAAPEAANARVRADALDLFSGEYLLGWDCGWAAAKRLVLEAEYMRLLLAVAECCGTNGDARAALSWLERGLLREPLHRELNYRLIEMLLQSHDRATAGKYYELYKSGLMKKYQAEPDTDLQRLLKKRF